MSRHNARWSPTVRDKDGFEIDTLFMKEVTSPHCPSPSLFFLLGEPRQPRAPMPLCPHALIPTIPSPLYSTSYAKPLLIFSAAARSTILPRPNQTPSLCGDDRKKFNYYTDIHVHV